ncbi:hypothetical protein FKM82_012241 [Ascaphus truei]
MYIFITFWDLPTRGLLAPLYWLLGLPNACPPTVPIIFYILYILHPFLPAGRLITYLLIISWLRGANVGQWSRTRLPSKNDLQDPHRIPPFPSDRDASGSDIIPMDRREAGVRRLCWFLYPGWC